ncbi:oligosaccharide flippase family protein [Gordonia sp. ABSL11-1]|uniref:lipopolysaccharide biosynthesis protein n=1 Tax=Gordonia sp. ABSL11-1 TaxID=3053924 RepID=UPI002572991E|nr:oligosaccharide flippase family protein [Gordonia sp. ABSL11-1]MDL9948866.1 oligosaccharide flippase family protein [Gordonia sp. ABSL11-1]
MDSNKGLRLNTAAQVLPLASGYLVNIVATPLIIAHLGVDEFGVWAVTGAIAQYGALLDLGTTRSVTRFISLHSSNGDVRAERATRTIAIAIIGALWSLLLCLSVPLAYLLSIPISIVTTHEIWVVLAASISMLIASMFSRAIAGFAFGHKRMIAMNIALSLGNIATIGGGLIALVQGGDLQDFALANAAGAAFGLMVVVIVLIVTEHECKLARPYVSETREFILFGLKGQATSVSDLFVLQFPKIALGIFVSPNAAGLYEIGSRIAMGARSLGIVAIMTLTPYFTEAYAREKVEGLRIQYYKYSPIYTFLAVFPIVAIVAVAPTGMHAWVGAAGDASVVIVLVLGLSFVINLATGTQTIAASAMNQMGRVAKSSMYASFASLIFTPIFTYLLGQAGALISVALAMSIGAITEFMYIGRILERRALTAARAPLRAVVIPVSLCVPVFVGLLFVPYTSRVQTLLWSTGGLIAYSGMVLTTQLIRKSRRKRTSLQSKDSRLAVESADSILSESIGGT